MENLLEKIIAFIIFSIMVFIIPLQSVYDRQEDVAYNYIYSEVNMFVEETLDLAMITPTRYAIFAEKLEAVGLTFDIRLEHKKKLYVPDPGGPDGFMVVYEGFYNEDILVDTLYSLEENYYLSRGDFFVVEVKNHGTTKAEAMRNLLYRGGGEGTLLIRVGGMVENEGY